MDKTGHVRRWLSPEPCYVKLMCLDKKLISFVSTPS